MNLHHRLLLLCACPLLLVSCGSSTDDPPAAVSEETYAGGTGGTVFNATLSCFQQPAPAVTDTEAFRRGEAMFDTPFVLGSGTPFSGLGPAYIRKSCVQCHPGYGRGRRQTDLSVQDGNGYLVFVHNPDGSICNGFTSMLQTHAVSPYKPPVERVDITWHAFVDAYNNTYPDGTPYNEGLSYQGTLIYPTASLVNSLLPVPSDHKVSLEATIGIPGSGLLDAIADASIIAEYERQKAAGGVVQGQHGPWITEAFDGKQHLGRFTFNCGRATLENGPGINALYSIFNLTRKDKPRNYLTSQWVDKMVELGLTDAAGAAALLGDQPEEITQDQVKDFMVWHRGLAVPAARNLGDATVQEGRKLFYDAKCTDCHKPSWTTGTYSYVPGYSNQKIWPYTDLLMHDMGEINKGRTRMFRTTPLWGRGLMKLAANHTDMFHDLRARNFEEAILWHFGEASASREAFRNLNKNQRAAMIKFLEAI